MPEIFNTDQASRFTSVAFTEDARKRKTSSVLDGWPSIVWTWPASTASAPVIAQVYANAAGAIAGMLGAEPPGPPPPITATCLREGGVG